ncbi:helix-turn-helix domain-containing protein [Nocardia sp. NBC_01503]|uniref:arsenate reductase/protein-tyrosine-phosphatase family protein n=1 Tax=Nocardia sp. NBC_01503 TaxID=2975997 RepID=UPI002E7C54F3|nr:helix-turn-helix domain-containing protein [Nocardia sp. NBC_01503]WTL31322.1 helix-turn-helix domain-containing protein [Nocardia sp. NBC_01503]
MSTEQSWSVERRAEVHAALADATRLRIVDALTGGDMSSSELCGLLSIPTNLMAHHLKALERVGMVERGRSEGDRRRSYLRLVPGFGGKLLPHSMYSAARVVFVCSRNTARSQLAAAAWVQRSTVPAISAGTHPAERVHPGAVATARRHRIPMRPSRPRGVDGLLHSGDLVIAVCDNAHEELPSGIERLHWSIPDPVAAGTDEAFDNALELIADRIDRIAAAVEPFAADDAHT